MRIVVAVCALALTAACSGTTKDQAPSASAFKEGTCRAAAADVLALGRATTRRGAADTVPGDVRSRLRDAQAHLDELAVAAEPPYQKVLHALVQSIGIARLRADGNEYDPALGRQLRRDYEAVLAVCT
jgi:hypothetical protein